MTKEELMLLILVRRGCPGDYRLKNHCKSSSCEKCWNQSLEEELSSPAILYGFRRDD